MSSLNISLPEAMKKYVDQRVAGGSYGTVSEYIRELIRHDQLRAAEADLEKKLLEGIESGPGIRGNEKYWEKKKSDLLNRLEKARRK